MTLLEPIDTHTTADPALDNRPAVLHCKNTADFLAALPRLVGFTAPNSMFILLQ